MGYFYIHERCQACSSAETGEIWSCSWLIDCASHLPRLSSAVWDLISLGFQVDFFVFFRISSGHQRKGICVSSFSVSKSLCCSVAEEWPRASQSQVCCERSCVISAPAPLSQLGHPVPPVLGIPTGSSLSLPVSPALLSGPSQCLLQVVCSVCSD